MISEHARNLIDTHGFAEIEEYIASLEDSVAGYREVVERASTEISAINKDLLRVAEDELGLDDDDFQKLNSIRHRIISSLPPTPTGDPIDG
jgi:hypothetical protein